MWGVMSGLRRKAVPKHYILLSGAESVIIVVIVIIVVAVISLSVLVLDQWSTPRPSGGSSTPLLALLAYILSPIVGFP